MLHSRAQSECSCESTVIATYWTGYIMHTALFLLVNTFLKSYNKYFQQQEDLKKSAFKRIA